MPYQYLIITTLWGKVSRQQTDTFLIFPKKIGFDISCKLGDILHKMSKPIFWEK